MSASPCPDANALAGYAARRLGPSARASVELHLDGCSSCLAIVVELARVDEGSSGATRAASEPVDGRFGKYRLEAIVGKGAMGTVYAAHDEVLDRRVALKILRRHADEAGARGRLTRESRAMARLSHPNVVTVHDAGEIDGRLYIAMELLEGATLGAWLRAETRPWGEALGILLHAGSGLAAAHEAGLVHRDFKPENVLLGAGKGDARQPRVVVTDFGLVAAPANEPAADEPPSAPAGDLALTRTGIVVGTPRYMSPEQFSGGTVDARSDQFSFAVTLYEALYGFRPFAGRSLDELRRAAMAGEVAPPPAETPVPPAVHRALVRALASDPDRRYPTLADMLRELRPFAPGTSEDEAPAAEPHRSASPRLRAAASLLMALALSALVLLVRHRRAPMVVAAASSEGGATGALVAAGRTIVVVTPFVNGTGDARMDGVSEELLASGLDCSLQLDAYAPADLPALGEELGAVEKETAAVVAARAVGDGKRVVLVNGRIVSADGGGSLALSVDAVDGASRKTLAHFDETLGNAGALSDAVARLGQGLRQALGVDARAEGAAPRAFSSSLDALAAWTEARTHVAARAWTGAVEAGQRALAADPAFALARADYAWSLWHDSRTPEATAAYAAAVTEEGLVCERQRLKGLAVFYGLQPRPAAAAHVLEQYLALWPSDLPAQTLMTSMLLDDRDWPVGLEVAGGAVREHPRALLAHTSYMTALFFAGDNPGVEREGELLLTMAARPPRHAAARLIVADAFLGRDDDARAVLQRQAPYDAEMSDEEEADLALFRGRIDQAETVLRRRIAEVTAQQDVTYARTENVLLAALYVRRGDLASARRVAETALIGARDEAPEQMLYQLGRVFVASHAERDIKAVADLLAARSTSPARLLGALLEGDRLRLHHQPDEAAARYADALRLDDEWLVHERMGELALDAGAFADAERELALCVRRRPEAMARLEPGLHVLSEPYLGLARAKDGGRKPDAAAAYRAFLANEPSPQNDPLADFARRRLKVLEASTTTP